MDFSYKIPSVAGFLQGYPLRLLQGFLLEFLSGISARVGAILLIAYGVLPTNSLKRLSRIFFVVPFEICDPPEISLKEFPGIMKFFRESLPGISLLVTFQKISGRISRKFYERDLSRNFCKNPRGNSWNASLEFHGE